LQEVGHDRDTRFIGAPFDVVPFDARASIAVHSAFRVRIDGRLTMSMT
jgi:hypothetical protein